MATAEDLLQRTSRGPLLLDGGMGSMLIAAGLPRGLAPEHWNLEHPDRVAAVHRAYALAGSDVVHANTFGASPPKLLESGLSGQCGAVCAAAVQLAREAVGDRVWVAGDVGPTGLMLAPMGTATESQLEDAFAEQIEALARAGADLLSIETMYDLREARAAVRAARPSGLLVLASMTFDLKKRGFFTLVGDRVGPSLQALVAEGAHAVGFNCTLTSDQMVALVTEALGSVEVPVVAQPNAGQPRPTAAGVVYDADPVAFTADLMAMVDAGALIIGGCCGTEPHFLALARAALDARKRG